MNGAKFVCDQRQFVNNNQRLMAFGVPAPELNKFSSGSPLTADWRQP